VPVRNVFAQVVTKRFVNSYADIKQILTGVFGLKVKDFAGVTRAPDNTGYVFLVDEEALLKYMKTLPHKDAGYIMPWSAPEFKTTSLVTTIATKTLENKCKNKHLRKDAKCILDILNHNGNLNPEDFLVSLDARNI